MKLIVVWYLREALSVEESIAEKLNLREGQILQHEDFSKVLKLTHDRIRRQLDEKYFPA